MWLGTCKYRACRQLAPSLKILDFGLAWPGGMWYTMGVKWIGRPKHFDNVGQLTAVVGYAVRFNSALYWVGHTASGVRLHYCPFLIFEKMPVSTNGLGRLSLR